MAQIESSRSHGLSETNVMGMREYIRGYSLIDITNTGVLAQYNPGLPTFLDNADQVVNGKDAWDRSRNQQRNWETLTQLISMITQPTILQQPVIMKNQDLSTYKFGPGYTGVHTVWGFTLGAEQTNVFDSPAPAGRLIEICHKIPIITNLKETVQITNPIIDTENSINLYFEKASF